MKSKKFVIIDGNALIHRAYHAIPPLTAKDGTLVNAVYGFTSMLLKVITDLKPEYLAVSFDVAGGTFRDEIYEDYKATRVKADQDLYDQIPLCHEVVETFDIPIYTKKGYEADDVIATVVAQVKSQKSKVKSVIVTGDQDLLQLVDKETEVYLLRRGMSDFHLFDEKAVKDKYGFGPKMMIDYKALRGDSSDNIPGVKGVGEKTAKMLLDEVGGVETIYKKIKRLKDQNIKESVIKKLEAGKEDALMSKELATIMQDVPGVKFKLEDAKVNEFNQDKISKLLRKFEFYSLIKRVPGNTEKIQNTKDTKLRTTKNKFTIVDKNNFAEFKKDLENERVFACREILSGDNVLDSELLGLVFVVWGKSYYLKFGDTNLTDETGLHRFLKQIFEDDKKTVVGHDIKQLVKVLKCSSAQVLKCDLFDIMVASYLLNSSTRAHDMKAVVLRELGQELPSGSDQASLFGVDPKIVAQELSLILQIQKKYHKDLEKNNDLGLFEKVEMALIPVLAEMELNGVAVDTKMLDELSQQVHKTIKKLTKKIHKEAGEEFNIASSVQLRKILFEKLELPTQGIKKGKTGYSTAAAELEKLREEHDIIKMIEEFRETEKLRNTYIDVLPKLINKKTGRIHTTFNQAVTTTGRLSSSEPNLQNIPIRTKTGKEVRKAFVAEKGYSLIVADYSQIELRIVASLSKDKKLIEVFERGEDVHSATAAAINGVKLEEVTKEMRYSAKEVNFGVLYGMGAYGLAWRSGITRWEAKEFIDKYFQEFSGVKKYLDQTLKFAKKEGYVETLFGRRRYIPELISGNFQLKNAGERMAINMPIQGTAADVMKMAMIKVHARIHEFNTNKTNSTRIKPGDIKLILQVHDELVLEVKEGLEDEVSKLVKDAMEGVVELNVPVEVHVEVGKRWGDLK